MVHAVHLERGHFITKGPEDVGRRDETLHEPDRDRVYSDLGPWLDRMLDSRQAA